MKGLINFRTLAASAVMLAALTACHSDEPETVTEQSFQKCYATVIDRNSVNNTVCSPVTVKLTLNHTRMTATAQISGLNLGGSTVITLTDVPYKYDRAGYGVIDIDELNVSATAGAQYLLDDLKMTWLDRFDLVETLQEYSPSLYFSFIANNSYKVTGARQPFQMAGTTVSTPAGGQAFTTKQSFYSTSLDFSNYTADIAINKAQFINGMPVVNIVIPGVGFSFAADASTIELAAAAITPTSGGVPKPDYAITDLAGTIDPEDGTMDLEFTCTVHGMPFKVVATLDYEDYKGVIQ